MAEHSNSAVVTVISALAALITAGTGLYVALRDDVDKRREPYQPPGIVRSTPQEAPPKRSSMPTPTAASPVGSEESTRANLRRWEKKLNRIKNQTLHRRSMNSIRSIRP